MLWKLDFVVILLWYNLKKNMTIYPWLFDCQRSDPKFLSSDGSNFRQWQVPFQNVHLGKEHIMWIKIILFDSFSIKNLWVGSEKSGRGHMEDELVFHILSWSQDIQMNSMHMIFGTWPLVRDASWDFSLARASSAYSSHLLIYSKRCLKHMCSIRHQ